MNDPGTDTPPPKRRRLSGPDRRETIIDSAARLFAEQGFAGSTRELAARLGVTQALLYRYFPSKQDLIESVFAAFRGAWDGGKAALLEDRSVPLLDRLMRFYEAYIFRHRDYRAVRLFMHAALAGIDIPLRYGEDLDALVLRPALAALRAEAGLPPPPETMARAERDLMLGTHGAIVFIGIRRWIYGATMTDARHLELVRGIVAAWLPGALETLKLSYDHLSAENRDARVDPSTPGTGRVPGRHPGAGPGNL